MRRIYHLGAECQLLRCRYELAALMEAGGDIDTIGSIAGAGGRNA